VDREKEAEGEGLRVGEVLLHVGAVKGREGEGARTETVKNKLSGVGKTMREKVHDDGGYSDMRD
ncbi:hypothetical protein A2U01_0110810, partial [Trifolium medium]|nr:hypothetical protein [Trifolium medium]